MKTKITYCIAMALLSIGTGCTTVVKYDLEDVKAARQEAYRQNMNVAVAPLQDMRPKNEKINTSTQSKHTCNDKMFKDHAVAKGISEALVTHFNHIQLFKNSELVEDITTEPNDTIIANIHTRGYDALFSGKITHFYGAGYVTGFDRAAIAMAAVPITALITIPIMLAQDNKNEGYVELIDLKLTDTSSGKVLWENSFSKKMEMSYSDVYPTRAACETLKEIANEMVSEIEAVDFSTLADKQSQNQTALAQ